MRTRRWLRAAGKRWSTSRRRKGAVLRRRSSASSAENSPINSAVNKETASAENRAIRSAESNSAEGREISLAERRATARRARRVERKAAGRQIRNSGPGDLLRAMSSAGKQEGNLVVSPEPAPRAVVESNRSALAASRSLAREIGALAGSKDTPLPRAGVTALALSTHASRRGEALERCAKVDGGRRDHAGHALAALSSEAEAGRKLAVRSAPARVAEDPELLPEVPWRRTRPARRTKIIDRAVIQMWCERAA